MVHNRYNFASASDIQMAGKKSAIREMTANGTF